MKKSIVVVKWRDGLHLRRAGSLVKLAQRFQSKVVLRLGTCVAEAGSILSLLILCATVNSVIEVEASGTDELEALAAVEEFFGEVTDEFDSQDGASRPDPV